MSTICLNSINTFFFTDTLICTFEPWNNSTNALSGAFIELILLTLQFQMFRLNFVSKPSVGAAIVSIRGSPIAPGVWCYGKNHRQSLLLFNVLPSVLTDWIQTVLGLYLGSGLHPNEPTTLFTGSSENRVNYM